MLIFEELLQKLTLISFFITCSSEERFPTKTNQNYFKTEMNTIMNGHVIARINVSCHVDCALKCTSRSSDCKSFNFVQKFKDSFLCELNDKAKHCVPQNDIVFHQFSSYSESLGSKFDETCSVCKNGGKFEIEPKKSSGFTCACKTSFTGERCEDVLTYPSCRNMSKENPSVIMTSLQGKVLQVYCDAREAEGGWTLIARYSNSDSKHWMENNGTWWFDRQESYGNTLDPAHNGDMISQAFWLLKGSEFKVTKSNDENHTALLTTEDDCLAGKTFRSKMMTYGVFRQDSSWAEDTCKGTCLVNYGGDYAFTAGFAQSQCDSDLQTRNKTGFWCDYKSGDSSVIMIGGGGTACSRADHGIGITEANDGSFKTHELEQDFGDEPGAEETSYALNLWVR